MASIVGTWRFEDVGGAGVDQGRPPVLEFAPDGTVSGSTGVNRLTGPYRLEGDVLQIGALATTRMMGPEHLMDIERAVLEVLAEPLTVVVSDGGAILALQGGQTTSRLVAEPVDAVAVDSGAAGRPEPSGAPSPGRRLELRGQAYSAAPTPLPAGSRLEIALLDTARADAPAEVLATAVAAVEALPAAWVLEAARDAVLEAGAPALRARVVHDDALLWTTDTHVAVDVFVASEPIALQLVPVAT